MARFLHRRVVSHYGFVVVPLPQTLVEGWPIHRVDTPRIFQRCQRFICANHVSQSNPPILCRGNPCGCPGWYAPACHVGDGLGAHKGRPYQYNNSMNMVGHCDKRVHLDGWKTVGHFRPNTPDHFSCSVQAHSTVSNGAEQPEASLHHNGHKVRTRLRIVISLQPHRSTSMDFRIVHAHSM